MTVQLTPADADRRRRLVRMKLFATGLLMAMAVVFVIAHLLEPRHPWAGYLRAAAEAGMVGALADWFAVTALFRRPLRLPIPHTAIIPNRKDAIGASLSDFVATNFLSEQVVRDKLGRLTIGARVGEYLATPAGAARIIGEIAGAATGLMSALSDEQIARLLESLARKKLAELRVGPPLGRILTEVFSRGDHHAVVDTLVDRLHTWIQRNPSTIVEIVQGRAPVWTPKFIDAKIADRVYREVAAFIAAVRSDPDHRVRQALDAYLQDFAADLQTDPAMMARADAIKDRVVADAGVRQLAGSAWQSVKQTLLAAVADPDSELRRSAVLALQHFGDRLIAEPELAASVDGRIADAAGYLARNHARSITAVIDETIARWDGEATSRKIELQVGRDLQFIRINGTVVGSLAGLVIYTLAQWLL